VNATLWPWGDEEQVICSSKRGSVKTHHVPERTKSGGSGGAKGFRGWEVLMLLVLGVGWVGLVV
jgi:hypothetical protein